MNDTYFFGKRMSFNEGGRARFNVGGTGNKDAEALGFNYISDNKYLQDDFTGSTPLDFSNTPTSGIMTQAPIIYPPINQGGGGGEGGGDDDDDDDPKDPRGPTMTPIDALKNAGMFMLNPLGFLAHKAFGAYRSRQKAKADLAADQAYKAKQERDFKEMAANTTNRDGTNAAYNYAGRVSSGGRHDSTKTNEEAQDNQDAGRRGYFFGGRVNYKAGGRTDAGANRSTASKAGVGQINEAGNKVDGGNYNDGGNDGGGGIKPTLFNNPEIFDKKTIFGDMPTGIGFDNSYGRYKATLDLEKSLKEKALEGEIEYNNTVGDFNFGGKYDTKDGATYGVGYTGNNFDVNVNNQTGLSGGFSKDIGPGTLTASGTYDPITGEFNTEARYGISFGKGKKDGGRIGFKNGGLAGLL